MRKGASGRWQVLYETPDGQQQVTAPSSKRAALAAARRLEAEGCRNVRLWDTLDNPLSNMFSF